MDKLKLETTGGKSTVYFGRAWDQLDKLISPGKTVIITDENVNRIYSSYFPDCPVIVVAPGEVSKSFDTLKHIIESMLRLEADRSWFVLGIGGGVVSDLTGFVASIYMRGIRFGFVSTSLLAQVDASTGGYKNITGCFNQPDFVVCDPELLLTLPEEEFRAGLAELIKHAIIKDKQLFELISLQSRNIKPSSPELMRELVSRSVSIKAAIVEKDERERAERRLLNFGHTIGHAIEAAEGIKHGLAVARGMYFSCLYSYQRDLLGKEEFEKIISLFNELKLFEDKPLIAKSLTQFIRRDKKRASENIHFVWLEKIGKGFVEEIKIDTLLSWIDKISVE